MKRLLYVVFPFTLVIGLIALFPFILGINNSMTIVTEQSTQIGSYTWNYYTIDIHLYLQNLTNSIDLNNLKNLIIKQPLKPEKLDSIEQVLNYIIYGFNWQIYVLNYILLTPIKLLLYPLNILFTVLGYNTTNTTYVEVIEALYNFNIPYIKML